MEYMLRIFLIDANKRAGNCRFTISNNNLPIMPQYSVYGFQKNWRYTDLANYKWVLTFLFEFIYNFTILDRLLRAWDTGLIDYQIKANKVNIGKCQLDRIQESTAKIRRLSLVDLSGPFMILVLGFSISLLVFLIEIIISRWKPVIRTSWNKQ